jgi:acyl-CoA synthetase (NDP forming)
MLETEIKKLTKAIETLTAVMEAQGVAVEQPKAEEQLEQPKAEEPKAEPTVTHDEVKDLCLKISRADRLKKPAIKAVLSEYGAKTVAQVAAESLGELKSKLEALQ